MWEVNSPRSVSLVLGYWDQQALGRDDLVAQCPFSQATYLGLQMHSAKPKDLQKLVFLVWSTSLPESKAAAHPAQGCQLPNPAHLIPTLQTEDFLGNFCVFRFPSPIQLYLENTPVTYSFKKENTAWLVWLGALEGEGPGQVGTFFLANFKEGGLLRDG